MHGFILQVMERRSPFWDRHCLVSRSWSNARAWIVSIIHRKLKVADIKRESTTTTSKDGDNEALEI